MQLLLFILSPGNNQSLLFYVDILVVIVFFLDIELKHLAAAGALDFAEVKNVLVDGNLVLAGGAFHFEKYRLIVVAAAIVTVVVMMSVVVTAAAVIVVILVLVILTQEVFNQGEIV